MEIISLRNIIENKTVSSGDMFDNVVSLLSWEDFKA
jgi:hypothetical protein